jgi:hypothetical protein
LRAKDDIQLSAEEQALAERGQSLVAAAVADTSAPLRLREAIERDRAKAAERPRRSLPSFGRVGAGVGVLAAAAVGVVIAVGDGGGGGGGGKLTLATVISIGQHSKPTQAAPAASGGRLNVSVDGVAFPNWTSLKWPAVGRRTDSMGGRRIETVFYRSKALGQTISYSIVSGDPLPEPKNVVRVPLGNEIYSVQHTGAQTFITWEQAGQTCVVVSSSLVADSKLVKLASTEAPLGRPAVKPPKLGGKL